MIIGRDQTISFYRLTTFTYAPCLCLCLLLLSTLKNRELQSVIIIASVLIPLNFNTINNRYLPAILQKVVAKIDGHYDYGSIKTIISQGLHFITGRYSIADAYQHQQGWPGRMPWGGIYPPMKTIWAQLPPKTRIWSMHIHSYCMLPNCHIEGYMSFRFTHQPLKVYYGEPREAKYILQQEGLNYFFIANSLQLTDFLPRTPLFSPEHIADFLGIAWTDGNNTLLTWKENSQEPLSPEWIRTYKNKISVSDKVTSFPYETLKIALIQAKNHTYSDAKLPWYRANWK